MDVTQQMRKARGELEKFQSSIRTKKLEREKLQAEIQEDEGKIREIRAIERDMRLKRSRLGRLDAEIVRLDGQQKRLAREIPNMVGALRGEERGGRRFGKPML